jgi:hypothetical protein
MATTIANIKPNLTVRRKVSKATPHFASLKIVKRGVSSTLTPIEFAASSFLLVIFDRPEKQGCKEACATQ